MTEKFKSELREIASRLDEAARSEEVVTGAATRASDISPDEPIHSSVEDRLNRSGFAEQLARAIVKFDGAESVVVGIHGRWGTGKTSLLNLVAEQLGVVSEKPPLIFWFNPWGFSDQEQLTARFFAELAAFLRLHLSMPPLVGISDVVEEYGEILSPVARVLFPRASEAVRVGWRWFRKLRPAPRRSAAELKAQINSALRAAGSRLILMVDDIDRLNAIEIRQAFQLIKLNANFANTVYVVAFDRRPVERALKEIAPGPATEYLEKIVQVSFNIPPISESTLTEIIVSDFNSILAKGTTGKFDEQRFYNMFQSGFRSGFRTLRDVNRFFNLFRFALSLMGREVDFVDLAAMQALSLLCPHLYHAIEANPDLFRGGWGSLDQHQDRETLRGRYEKLFAGLRGVSRKWAEPLCQFLFPKMERTYGPVNSIYGPEWEKAWEKAKRVASSKYFTYYFQLAVPDTEVSQAEFGAALAAANSTGALVECLERFKNSNRFPQFIDSLRENLSSLSREQLSMVLESIFVFGDHVSTEGAALFGQISEYLRFGMWLFLDVLDLLPAGRFETVCGFMRERPAVFTISDVTAMCEKIVRDETGSTQLKTKYPDLTEGVVSEMKAATVDAIELAAREGRLQAVPQLGAVLYRWRLWGDPGRASEWVSSTFLKNPKGAASFVAAFARTVSSMGLSDRVPRVRLAIALKDLSAFADLRLIADLLRSGSDADLTPREREAKDRFLAAKSKLDAGRDPDLLFPEELNES